MMIIHVGDSCLQVWGLTWYTQRTQMLSKSSPWPAVEKKKTLKVYLTMH